MDIIDLNDGRTAGVRLSRDRTVEVTGEAAVGLKLVARGPKGDPGPVGPRGPAGDVSTIDGENF